MRSARRNYGKTPYVLLLLVGAFAYADWRVYWATIDISPLASIERPQTEPSGSPEFPAATLPHRTEAMFPQTVARPLFHPDRKPIERAKPAAIEAPPPPPAPPPPLDKLQLVGVMRTGVNQYRALIRSSVDAPGEWLAVGDQIQGWLLRAIETDSVVLSVARPADAAAGQQYKLYLLGPQSLSEGG